MLDQNVPNPLAKNPNFHTHKVFAAIGIILIAVVIICGGVWYFVQSAEDKAGTVDDNTIIKTSTSSAKKSTESAKKDETADWKTYENKSMGISVKHPNEWVPKANTNQASNPDYYFSITSQSTGEPAVHFYKTTKSLYDNLMGREVGKSTVSGEYNAYLSTRLKNIAVDGTTALIEENLVNPDLSQPAFDPTIKVYYERSGSYYLVQFIVNSDSLKEIEKTFYLIVSTIKFL